MEIYNVKTKLGPKKHVKTIFGGSHFKTYTIFPEKLNFQIFIIFFNLKILPKLKKFGFFKIFGSEKCFKPISKNPTFSLLTEP